MDKQDWVVLHGGVWQGGHKGVGKTVSLTEKEALEVDPTIKDGVGTSLILKSKHDRNAAGEKAKADKIAELEKGEKAKADHHKK